MAVSAKPKPRTVDDFKAAHDKDVIIPAKIRAGLAKLLEVGPQHYEYDEGFRALCGVQGAQMAAYRDLPEFAKYWFMAPNTRSGGDKGEKRVWFGDSKVAARLRKSPPGTKE
jgi:hypothetical protein